ncbi:hypothetical protein Tco_0080758 [Tanacetum coccineum]
MKRGFKGVLRPLLPVMLPSTNSARQEAQSPTSASQPQPTTLPPPTTQSAPTHIPKPTPTPTTPLVAPTTEPKPTTEPISEPLENIYEQPQSPTHSPAARQLNVVEDLTQLVPQLISRIDDLEKELRDTKQTYGTAIVTLVKRVKTLEVALKRKSRKLVISDSEGEESGSQGRNFEQREDDPLILLATEFMTPAKTKDSGEVQEKDISPTTLEAAKTLSKVATQMSKSVDKGKRYMRRKEI